MFLQINNMYHGLFGSPDDNEKLAMVVKKGRYFAEYEVYFKEKGTKQSSKTFTSETEACEFMYSKLKDEHTYKRIQKNSNLNAMTVNERLFATKRNFSLCDKSGLRQIVYLHYSTV